jgi:NhaA family Na+:H+ antiporter
MTLFFFVVGLEVKRELVIGELRDRRTAVLPAIAALGGMVVPALIFVAWTAGTGAQRGWGIPMATDIAFAVGVLSLVRPRVPQGLKLFLLTLAIVDDIGAILVITVFYAGGIEVAWLLGAVVAIGVILGLRAAGARAPALYILPGVALWACVSQSGIHATIAGVALGLLTPARAPHGPSPIERLEHRLHPLSSFAIIPLFALANAGVRIDGNALHAAASSRITWGILTSLILGKLVGVAGATLVARRLGLGRVPDGVRVAHVVGAAMLAGIGFTVSLFIADLAFGNDAQLAQAKLGVVAASLVAGAAGTITLARVRSSARDTRSSRRRARGALP